MPDRIIQCVDCTDKFVFTDKEQEFYKQQGYTDPKRCRHCRAIKKQKNEERAAAQQAQNPAPPSHFPEGEDAPYRKKPRGGIW